LALLAASAFNQLEQYASSPGKTVYTDAKKTRRYFTNGGRNHRQ